MTKKTHQILIVDDDPDYTYLLVEAINHCPQPPIIHVLHSGGELLDWLDTHQQPDLILLDINMPGGNGFDVLTILKGVDQFSAIPVIMLSVSGRREDVTKSYQQGANAFITKPMRFADLQERIALLSCFWAGSVKTPRASWVKTADYSGYHLN